MDAFRPFSTSTICQLNCYPLNFFSSQHLLVRSQFQNGEARRDRRPVGRRAGAAGGWALRLCHEGQEAQKGRHSPAFKQRTEHAIPTEEPDRRVR